MYIFTVQALVRVIKVSYYLFIYIIQCKYYFYKWYIVNFYIFSNGNYTIIIQIYSPNILSYFFYSYLLFIIIQYLIVTITYSGYSNYLFIIRPQSKLGFVWDLSSSCPRFIFCISFFSFSIILVSASSSRLHLYCSHAQGILVPCSLYWMVPCISRRIGLYGRSVAISIH